MDEYKTWLPEYSARSVITVDRWREEAESVRVVKCHSESGLKVGGADSSESSTPYVLPSSCSATCRKCRDIPYSLFVQHGPDLYVLYNNYNQLRVSADAGCCLCWFFVQHLRQVLQILKSHALHRALEDEDSDSPSELAVTLRRPEGVQQPGWILLFLGKFATRIYWTLAEDCVYRGRVSLHSGEAENIDLAKSWLSACLKDHDRCRSSPHTLNLSKSPPSRLIHIRTYSDLTKIRLVETAGRKWLESVPYLTLSHCWGREPSVEKMTTKDNIHSRMVDIPLEELPKTAQDAIAITLGLGFSFIWIDAICIVQDSTQDWESVCRSMASIYSNSVCTIAASAATDDHGGCLVQKDINLVGWVGIDFPYPGSELVTNRIICDQKWPPRICTTAKEILLHPAMRDPRSLIDSEPLSQRGWCLQERLLSPRVLYFTKQELVWECETTWSFEDSLRATVERRLNSGDSYLQNKTAIYDAWFSIIRAFTDAKLTRYTDRLPALSGLADAFLKKLPDEEYVAGLWKGDTIRGLLWAKNGSNPRPSKAPPTYLAPSWSWASVDGPIYYPPIEIKTEAPSLIDLKVTVTGLDPLGEVTGGYLLLRGRLKPVRRGRPVPSGSYLPPPRALVELPPNYSVADVRKAEMWLSQRFTLVDCKENDADSIYGQIYFDDERDSSLESLYCLQMAQTKTNRQTTTYVIALVRTEGSSDCAFRRVGIGEILRRGCFNDCRETSLKII